MPAAKTEAFATPFSAGALYFLLVFAAGFATGAARTAFVTPWIGEVGAVLVEIPVMLTVAWVACRWVLKRFGSPQESLWRLVMSSSGLVFLLVAEATTFVALTGGSLHLYLLEYREAPTLLGLLAQLVYAAFPVAQLRSRHGSPGSGGNLWTGW